MANAYWLGSQQAHLTQEKIPAEWGHGPHCGARIDFVNRAFEIYYQACRRIRTCTDWEQRWLMESELHKAARTGWGFGISDLEDAFEHLVQNNGRWTDTATSHYFGGPGKVLGGGLVEAPVSIVNFMNAVDQRLQRLHRLAEQHRDHTDDALRAAKAGDWTTLDRVLGAAAETAVAAMPLLWWVSESEARPRLARWAGRAISAGEAVSAINNALNTYRLSIGARFGPGASAGLAALRGALTYLPVLGEYYGMALDLVPALRGWFRGVMEDRHRRLTRAAAGAL